MRCFLVVFDSEDRSPFEKTISGVVKRFDMPPPRRNVAQRNRPKVVSGTDRLDMRLCVSVWWGQVCGGDRSTGSSAAVDGNSDLA